MHPVNGLPVDGDRQYLMPPGLNTARARNAAYSYGVRTGDVVWLAGQISREADGSLVGSGDIAAQTIQCFENMRKVVEEAGGSMNDIVMTTTYITDRAHRNIVNDIRLKYFHAPHLPASTLIVVAALALPEYLIEIDAIAVVNQGSRS
ncbi:RidA family protein [Microvirga antarctica]|uniref:RidA family protein n=1 Tax=Microvirga antarctica TaxID=2819233 RepID=UPI001B3057B4|nr:RidA family protein [Microvirga antarctica]